MKNRKPAGRRSKSFVTPPSRRKIESLWVPTERISYVPELRKDPIVGRWVIISTDRAKRPTDFVREPVKIKGGGFCPLNSGNENKTPPEILAYRPSTQSATGQKDSAGWTVRV